MTEFQRDLSRAPSRRAKRKKAHTPVGYEVLRKEEERLFDELVEEMFSYTSKSVKEEHRITGHFLSGMVRLGGFFVKRKVKKTAKDSFGFFLGKVRDSMNDGSDISGVMDGFEKKFYVTYFTEEEMERCNDLIRLEARRYERLMGAEGKDYHELFRNAYSSRKEALGELERIYGEEKEFFSGANLPGWFVSQDFTRKLTLGGIELRKRKYEKVIEEAFG